MSENNGIVIKNVSKYYGRKQALKNISLEIKGGMFGLLGRNGAGKTTLMKTLAGLLKKQSGEMTVCGIPIENSGGVRAVTGYLPQEFSMYPEMTVCEAMDYLGTLSGMTADLRRERTDMLLTRVNLNDKRKSKIKSLSGGMKRRLGIAQALLHDPRVLIADEPTAGLDPEERIRFRNLLSEAAEDRTVILSTHIVGDVEAACGDIAIMNEGEILWQGTVPRLVDEAEGKVFLCHVQKKFLPQVKKEHIVTGMLAQGEYAAVRIVSEDAPDMGHITPADPNAEDAYMYCLFRNGCIKGGENI
ncbi:MAG: ABC transporter ATP-binding protein [Ruminococcus sp.]|nr:ABC transporter ATP-binding protein [Ruminococcus sp.]